MSASRPTFFAGRDLWQAPVAELLEHRDSQLQALPLPQLSHLRLHHASLRPPSDLGGLGGAGRNGGGGGAGGRHQCFFSYQTFAVLGCLVLASALCMPFGRPNVALERMLPRFGAVGEPLRYRIGGAQLARQSQNALTLIEELPDPRPTFEEFAANARAGRRTAQLVRPHLRLLPLALAAGTATSAPTSRKCRVPDLPARRRMLDRGRIDAVAPRRAAFDRHDGRLSRSLRVVSLAAENPAGRNRS